ncbi:MAG TPA: 3-isopropylmalate dehydratase large subunit [Planctomycetota bacterium]|nr:3-isopropylmalate dehydratase large subunit [Planctomycetota bacterium]
MALTLSEKILSEHAGREVRAGELAVVPVDLVLTQDGTGPLAVRQVEKMAGRKVANPKGTVMFLDHAAPSPRMELSNDHKTIREFAEAVGAQLCDIEAGVCHQVINEKYVFPGAILVGSDSHTCTGGALGAFATGMGSTDVAVAIAFGKTWFRVPETYRVKMTGSWPAGVFSKDFILHLIGMLGADGANYIALEFTGPALTKLNQSERFTIANMAIEAGAKVGLMPTDGVTKKYLERAGRGDKFRELKPDAGAKYARKIEIDVAQLSPMIACPHTVDNVKPVKDVAGTPIHQVFMGSCTNGRLEDLEIFTKIVAGKTRHKRTRVIVTPASRDVYKAAVKKGLIEKLIDFGASINTPGCGACVGVHGGILGNGENCLATSNRNFKGRMGNPDAGIYLGSPASAAAAALAGEIADPRELFKAGE